MDSSAGYVSTIDHFEQNPLTVMSEVEEWWKLSARSARMSRVWQSCAGVADLVEEGMHHCFD